MSTMDDVKEVRCNCGQMAGRGIKGGTALRCVAVVESLNRRLIMI